MEQRILDNGTGMRISLEVLEGCGERGDFIGFHGEPSSFGLFAHWNFIGFRSVRHAARGPAVQGATIGITIREGCAPPTWIVWAPTFLRSSWRA